MSSAVRHLLSVRGFHLGMGGYLLALYVLRIVLFPGASEDDAEQIFFAQSLSGGYKPGQPPLYTWIVYSVTQIAGVSLAVVVAIKFAALAAIYGLSFRLARLMGLAADWAAFAALSVFALYYIGWDSVLNYSQTVLMTALCLAALHGVMRIAKGHAGWIEFIYLGVVTGAGVMTKYNFAIFLVAMFGAALMDRELRRALLSSKGLLVVVLVGLIALPHGLWLLGGHVGTEDLARAVPETAGFSVATRLSGLGDMSNAVFSILSPLLILFLIFFPKAFLPIQHSSDATLQGRRLLERGGVIILVIMALVVVVSGITEVRNHWFLVLIAFPVYGTLRIAAVYREIALRRVSWYLCVLVVLAGVVMIVLAGRALQGAEGCRKCRLIVPFSELADKLRQSGFKGGTIVTYDYPTQVSGNLRRYFPDQRFLSMRFNSYVPPLGPTVSASGPDQCLVVWHLDSRQKPDLAAIDSALQSRLAIFLENTGPMQVIAVPLDGLFDPPGTHVMRFGYVLINDQTRQGAC